MHFLTKLEAIRHYTHLFPGTFYHLHLHVKFAAFNHWVDVFTLLIHFHLVASVVFIHLHTIIGRITEKFLLKFVKKETPAQWQQEYESLQHVAKGTHIQKLSDSKQSREKMASYRNTSSKGWTQLLAGDRLILLTLKHSRIWTDEIKY